jgi:hypothetical protein
MENLRTGVRDTGQRETYSLIGSDKVEGTRVYSTTGDHIGHIERVMIGKLDGRVSYAVLAFGGFLGIGKDYYPLPWSSLTYNPALGGYEVAVTEEQLRGAPRYAETDDWNWEDQAAAASVDDYWRRYH